MLRFERIGNRAATTLLRYLHCRKRTRRGSTPSAFSSATAGGKAGFLSTLVTRGTGLPGELRTLRKKRLAAAASRFRSEQKVNRLPGGIHRAVEAFVFTLDLYIGLVSAIAFVGGFQMRPTALVQLGCMGLHPAPDASRVHGNAAFRQKLRYVLVGERISKVAADAKEDHLAREMSPFEGIGRGDRHEILPYQTVSRISQWHLPVNQRVVSG
jgi:hypothetical protein